MFKELSQLGSLLKQAQSLSGKLQDVQQRLKTAIYVGTSASGQVQIDVGGDGQVAACRLAPEFVQQASTAELEQAVITATNEALTQLRQRTAAEMGEVTEGLNLGGLGASLGLGGHS